MCRKIRCDDKSWKLFSFWGKLNKAYAKLSTHHLTADTSPPTAFSVLSPSTRPFSTLLSPLDNNANSPNYSSSLPSTITRTSLADRRLWPAVALLRQASSLRDMGTRILSPFVHYRGHALLYSLRGKVRNFIYSLFFQFLTMDERPNWF